MGAPREKIEKTLQIGRHRRRWPVWLRWGLGVGALGLVALVMLGRGGEDAVRYLTEEARRGPLSVTVSATGTVEPTNLVEVSSELSGTLAEVLVDHNDPVAVGQVLARLDTRKLQAEVDVRRAALIAAEARVEQAQTTLDEAYDNFATAEELETRGVTSHQALVAARAAYLRANAALQIADADRALAEATLDLTRADLEKAVILSPIKGVILERDADAGQIVASALSAPTLFTIAEDLASMELRVDVDEADIGLVGVGNRAVFTVDAYDDESFPARITLIRYAPESTEGVVTYKAVLSIDNSHLRLRPGMTATADIIVQELDDVLMVPNAALRFVPPASASGEGGEKGSGLLGLLVPDPPGGDTPEGGYGNSLWVLRDGQPVLVKVTTGLSDGRYTVVLSGELAEGDLVITDQAEDE
ncbi:efflux RND transporter periplasmic adaptor subunit [Actibacterium sp. XHP0104]|uniref:efflux RND transporter periplasmic adaptor subunit n=1 Tax=Actibacterium sp. XHP0104 TaxID=2984335 RepID=UPI0021E99417|nr:efflux RND transporter periplasmic adaptor subunit [Actibacterium sp. XHP0104]MCV2880751.1 efflux RND transporter periplasmic adaptor subunit [Actibacterium sp. XHP0104]